jgi:hypothetical protein
MVAKLVTTMFFVVVLGEFWALRNGWVRGLRAPLEEC